MVDFSKQDEFLSTPSARRATQGSRDTVQPYRHFYPRPPRGGRRSAALATCCWFLNFYPRPPRGGRPGAMWRKGGIRNISIHALREEGDITASFSRISKIYFYPRPPRGGRPARHTASSHVLYFYPRPPRGGRPLHDLAANQRMDISIHALREEGDPHIKVPLGGLFYFYPRPPRGGRQQKQRQNLYFQTNYTTFCTNLEEP